MNVEITVRVWRDQATGEYIAHALPLDVSSFGRTPAEAKEMVHEAVQAFIQSTEETGALDEVMAECGYQKRGTDWVKPEVSEEELSVAVGR